MSNGTLENSWTEVKTLVELLDKDVQKNLSGNLSAGVRVRKGLRELARELRAVVKQTLETDRAHANERRGKKKST